MNRILEIFNPKSLLEKKNIPIWMMRQAGRYLPEYREIRSQQKDFMEFCFDKNAAANVTLQPLKRFDLDAAIIFSDILTIPQALGYKVDFSKGEGPKLFKPNFNIAKNKVILAEELKDIYETISMVKLSLNNSKALIGFSGAPWTLLCYMFTDGSKQYANVKQLAYSLNREFYDLLEIVKKNIITHLKEQIKAGADLVQIFDSWSGLLDEYYFDKLVIEQLEEIVLEVKKDFPNTPIIVFAKDAGVKTLKLAERVKPDGISLSYTEDIKFFSKELPRNIVTQGNLDPVYLQTEDLLGLERETNKILQVMEGRKHIFNLGHGINPTARIENIYKLINIVRKYEKENCSSFV